MATTLKFLILGDDQASSSFDKFAKSVENSNKAADRNTAALRRAQVQAAATGAATRKAAADSDSAAGGFASAARSNGIAAALIESVATAPALLAGGAAIGAVLAGGIAAYSSSPQLQAAGRQLVAGLKKEVQGDAQSLVAPIGRAIAQVSSDARGLSPELKSAFAAAAPDVLPLEQGLDRLVSGALPGLVSLLREGQPAVRAFSDVLGAVGTGAGELLAGLGPAIGPASAELRNLGTVVQSVLGATGPLLSAAAVDAAPLADAIAATATAAGKLISATPVPVLEGIVGVIGGAVLATKALGVAEGIAATAAGEGFLASGIAGIKGFAAAAKGATLAEKALVASELAVEAVSPVAWAVVGAAAVIGLDVALVKVAGHTNAIADSTSAYVATLAKQDQATGYNISGYQKLSEQLGEIVAKQQAFNDQHQLVVTGGVNSGIALAHEAQQLAAVTAQYKAATAQYKAFSGNVAEITGRLGISADAAYQLASAAGVSGSQLAATGKAGHDAASKVIEYEDAIRKASDPTSGLSGDVATLDNNLLSATDQLNAFNNIMAVTIGNSLSSQAAILQDASSFGSLQKAIATNGSRSVEAKTAFVAYMQQVTSSLSTLVQNRASVQQVNSAYAESIAALGKLHNLTPQQQADVAALTRDYGTWASTTAGLSSKTVTLAGVIEGDFTRALQGAHQLTPAVNADVGALANSILKTGTTSSATVADRARLIHDLEAAGASAHDATGLVRALQGEIGALKGKAVGVKVVMSGSGNVEVVGSGIGTKTINLSTGQVSGGGGHTAAAGWYVSGGVPGRDSVPVMAMPGEVIVPTRMVAAGAVDHLRGKIPGFGEGGIVGGINAATSGVGTQEALWGQTWAAVFAADAVKSALAAAAASAAYSPGAPASGSAAAAQAFARSILPAGWSWPALVALWNRESGWNDNAVNASSGAYGIPQALGKGRPYALGDYANQVRWGISYIGGRYGDSQAAWAHEVAAGWYGNGLDAIIRKPTTIGVGEKGPEHVTVTPAGKQPPFATLHKWLQGKQHGARLTGTQLHDLHVAHLAHLAHEQHMAALTGAVTARPLPPPVRVPVAPRAPGSGGGGNVYSITVNVPATAHPAQVGKAVVEAVKEYERVNGASWRS